MYVWRGFFPIDEDEDDHDESIYANESSCSLFVLEVKTGGPHRCSSTVSRSAPTNGATAAAAAHAVQVNHESQQACKGERSAWKDSVKRNTTAIAAAEAEAAWEAIWLSQNLTRVKKMSWALRLLPAIFSTFTIWRWIDRLGCRRVLWCDPSCLCLLIRLVETVKLLLLLLLHTEQCTFPNLLSLGGCSIWRTWLVPAC